MIKVFFLFLIFTTLAQAGKHHDLNCLKAKLELEGLVDLTNDQMVAIIKTRSPHLTEEIIRRSMKSANDPHLFLRSFFPLFQTELKAASSALEVWKKLSKFEAWIVGDIHFENFGLMMTDKGIIRFGPNDFDQITKGSVVSDIIHNMLSSSMLSKDFDVEKYVKAYKKGLLDELVDEPKYIKNLKQKATDGIKDITSNRVTKGKDGIYKFTDLDPAESNKIDEAIHTKLEKKVKQIMGNDIKVHDSYLRIKTNGGSAGMKRYQLLVETHGEMKWVELKQTLLDEKQVDGAKKNFLNGEFDKSFQLENFEKEKYIFRYQEGGNRGIKINDVPEDKLDKVANYEGNALGSAHKKSLEIAGAQVEDYLKAIEEVSVKEWQEAVDFLKSRMKKLYQEFR